MFGEWKIYAAIAFVLGLAGAICLYGNHEYHAGAASVQAKWDAARVAQANTAVTAATRNEAAEQAQTTAFVGIESNYIEATTHAQPSLSVGLPAAIAAGTLQLRDSPVCPGGGGVSEATARSRAADAASTQALADRVQDSIAAVRAGDEADKRERQLAAQVTALQAIVKAERASRP